jgi:hypothetical protein
MTRAEVAPLRRAIYRRGMSAAANPPFTMNPNDWAALNCARPDD